MKPWREQFAEQLAEATNDPDGWELVGMFHPVHNMFWWRQREIEVVFTSEYKALIDLVPFVRGVNANPFQGRDAETIRIESFQWEQGKGTTVTFMVRSVPWTWVMGFDGEYDRMTFGGKPLYEPIDFDSLPD